MVYELEIVVSTNRVSILSVVAVLPKFSVEITPPPFVLVNEDEILVKVCARYVYTGYFSVIIMQAKFC